jgi:7-dehydrocholesterol reductase
MLAGVSFVAASHARHGAYDPGLVLCALSQFLYLVKFFVWEIGYMRSIDIITDRAGFYETWGCLVWVPSVYTLHTRAAVVLPSGLSWPVAAAIFTVGILGVLFNYQADLQRQAFRETSGKCTINGKPPVYIEAPYTARNAGTGKLEKHKSLLLASGWWGAARHSAYLFELMAAYSWGLLAGVHSHGALPLFYPVYLTILLVHRAHRDEQKCLEKYGSAYKKYMAMVPHKIVPYVY